MQIRWSGLAITDGRGKIGGNQVSRCKSGAIASVKTTPRIPFSGKQTAQQSKYREVTQSWSNLSEAERGDWDTAGADPVNKQINKTGEEYQPTGFQLYTSLNLNVGKTSFPLLIPPAIPTWSNVTLVGSTLTPGDSFLLQFGETDLSADQVIRVFGQRQVSAGRMSVKQPNYLFVRDIDNGEIANSVQILSDYQAACGTAVVGRKAFIKCMLVDVPTGHTTLLGFTSAIGT